ncbi:MAG: LVIVD repeat-containing protein, partial [Acidimicrobiia bacterium]
AYLAANPDGFQGNILSIIDLDDRSQPKEVGRWWVPGQHVAAGETPEHSNYLHVPAHVEGDLAYAGFGGAGMVILDVSDPTQPQKVGGLDFRGFGSRIGCHSVVPIPGTDLVAVNSEAIDEGGHEPHNYSYLVDVSDPTSPWVVGSVPQPTPGEGLGLRNYFDKPGRFGPHNQHHPQGDLVYAGSDLLFMTYFNAGLRIFDITEPRAPIEVACYVPETPVERRGVLPRELETQIEDVLVDRRGNIYCTDKNWGLFVLRAEVIGG